MRRNKCRVGYSGITMNGKSPVCHRLKHHQGAHEALLMNGKQRVTWTKDIDGTVHSSMDYVGED